MQLTSLWTPLLHPSPPPYAAFIVAGWFWLVELCQLLWTHALQTQTKRKSIALSSLHLMQNANGFDLSYTFFLSVINPELENVFWWRFFNQVENMFCIRWNHAIFPVATRGKEWFLLLNLRNDSRCHVLSSLICRYTARAGIKSESLSLLFLPFSEIKEYFENSYDLYETLFTALKGESYSLLFLKAEPETYSSMVIYFAGIHFRAKIILLVNDSAESLPK